MAEKPTGVDRGLFDTGRRKLDPVVGAADAATPAGIPAGQTVTLLGLITRLQNLEGILSATRLAAAAADTAAEQQAQVLVLDNEEAERRIVQLQSEIDTLNLMKESVRSQARVGVQHMESQNFVDLIENNRKSINPLPRSQRPGVNFPYESYDAAKALFKSIQTTET